MRNYPNYQIDMVRGDTLSFGLEFEGLGQDLESADFTVKKDDNDSTVLIHKDLTNGISKADDYKYIVRLAPEDTQELDAGYYHFDLQISVNFDVFTIMLGILVLEQGVTEEVTNP
jgi:hypothetical protein